MKTVVNPCLTFLIIIGISFASCEDDPAICEVQNSGTFIVENSHPEGNLQVHFNKPRVAGNSVGDLSIAPGETGSMELPAGSHKLVAILVISNCNGNRCQVSSSLQNESQEDLDACQTRNFVF